MLSAGCTSTKLVFHERQFEIHGVEINLETTSLMTISKIKPHPKNKENTHVLCFVAAPDPAFTFRRGSAGRSTCRRWQDDRSCGAGRPAGEVSIKGTERQEEEDEWSWEDRDILVSSVLAAQKSFLFSIRKAETMHARLYCRRVS